MREELTPEEIDSGLRYLIKDGLASQALATLTGGAFLVAFALQLGASNYHIGLLAAIPTLAQLVRFPATWLLEKHRKRRAMTVTAVLFARPSWLFIAFIPVFLDPGQAVRALLILLLVYDVFRGVEFRHQFSCAILYRLYVRTAET